MKSPEALSRACQAAEKTLGMKPFNVQVLAALRLLKGAFVEMATGEGKTLVTALAAAVQGQSGRVHVVTANPYLAERDALSMRPLYAEMGLTVSYLLAEQSRDERREAYKADIVYSTASELGFDWLRENLVKRQEDRVQPPLGFAIIDEVDAVLLDEAQTPLIIAEALPSQDQLFRRACSIIKQLEPGVHFSVDDKSKEVLTSEEGQRIIDAGMRTFYEGDIYEEGNIDLLHAVHAALQARALYRRGRDYIVTPAGVTLVDAQNGRLLEGRRLSAGLHEALETFEGFSAGSRQRTLATITYPEFFKMYKKVSGLSGTLMSDKEELKELYGLKTYAIPRNRPDSRLKMPDKFFTTRDEKYAYMLCELQDAQKRGQPVLLGCDTVREALYVGEYLKSRGVQATVLSALNPSGEAQVIERAGLPGSITVATQMAGRGTDILLGNGDPELKKEVLQAGGLYVLGLGRNFLRRVDDQLAGRCGRQGDVGKVQFLLSLDDPLMALFHSTSVLLSPRRLSRMVSSAQKRAAGMRFSERENQERLSSIVSKQREVFYAIREQVLLDEDRTPEDKASALRILDEHWSDYLDVAQSRRDLFFLKQKESAAVPKYQAELFYYFEQMLEAAKAEMENPQPSPSFADVTVARESLSRWVLRNEPCPCGSGKRYKHCHGEPA